MHVLMYICRKTTASTKFHQDLDEPIRSSRGMRRTRKQEQKEFLCKVFCVRKQVTLQHLPQPSKRWHRAWPVALSTLWHTVGKLQPRHQAMCRYCPSLRSLHASTHTHTHTHTHTQTHTHTHTHHTHNIYIYIAHVQHIAHIKLSNATISLLLELHPPYS